MTWSSDLTECTFLDSSAIRELLAGVRDIESGGGRAAVVAQPTGVRRTLEIAGVDERLAIHPTLEAALASGLTPGLDEIRERLLA